MIFMHHVAERRKFLQQCFTGFLGATGAMFFTGGQNQCPAADDGSMPLIRSLFIELPMLGKEKPFENANTEKIECGLWVEGVGCSTDRLYFFVNAKDITSNANDFKVYPDDGVEVWNLNTQTFVIRYYVRSSCLEPQQLMPEFTQASSTARAKAIQFPLPEKERRSSLPVWELR